MVIQLLALGTTDVLMSGMARGKHEMFEAFVTREGGEGEPTCGYVISTFTYPLQRAKAIS